MAEVSHGMNLLQLGQHQIQLKCSPLVQVYEGSSATLNWNFSLSVGLGLGFFIKFNANGIVSIRADGSAAGPIRAEFQKRFSVSTTPKSASLSISPVTIADDKSNGEFSCVVK